MCYVRLMTIYWDNTVKNIHERVEIALDSMSEVEVGQGQVFRLLKIWFKNLFVSIQDGSKYQWVDMFCIYFYPQIHRKMSERLPSTMKSKQHIYALLTNTLFTNKKSTEHKHTAQINKVSVYGHLPIHLEQVIL